MKVGDQKPQPRRRTIRLAEYDYSRAGAYFVTICTQARECFFGSVTDGKMQLNDAGRMVERIWRTLPRRFSSLALDQFGVMPNHLHGILILPDDVGRGESGIRPLKEGGRTKQGEHKVRPYGTLPRTVGRIVQAFKSTATGEYIKGVKNLGWPTFPGRLWQRDYYEHVIRNEESLNKIRQYILQNPLKWMCDSENPATESDAAVLEKSQRAEKDFWEELKRPLR